MQIVLDYVSGKIGRDEFKDKWYSNPEIGQWLDSLIDLKNSPKEAWNSVPYSNVRYVIHKYYGGSVLRFIEESEAFDRQQSGAPKWLDIAWYFDAIAAIIVIAFPDIVPTSVYDDEIHFYLNAVGDYLGGPEVEAYIANVLSSFPSSMGKTKRIKEAKASLRNHFHLTGNKYPRWCQEPEWPMGESSPMVFLSQKRYGERVVFTFKDADIGTVKQVEQIN